MIHYGFIEQFIMDLGTHYHIKEIAYDRWNATQMVQNLEDEGFLMVPFGQGFKDMSPPSKELYKLLMEGNIVHGGNPVLKWMAQNVVMRQDPAGNIKPDKERSVEKIDGIVALIMGLDRCIRNGGTSGSVYDERGIISFSECRYPIQKWSAVIRHGTPRAIPVVCYHEVRPSAVMRFW